MEALKKFKGAYHDGVEYLRLEAQQDNLESFFENGVDFDEDELIEDCGRRISDISSRYKKFGWLERIAFKFGSGKG